MDIRSKKEIKNFVKRNGENNTLFLVEFQIGNDDVVIVADNEMNGKEDDFLTVFRNCSSKRVAKKVYDYVAKIKNDDAEIEFVC